MKRRSQGASLSELETVYRARFPALRRVAAAIVGDREAALDVVQEAFGCAIRGRKSFYYYADLDYRTIAIVLGVQPGTVGATLNAARAALRRAVEVPR